MRAGWSRRLPWRRRAARRGGPVFVFPGQGSQWPGMALELLEESPVFERRFSECAAALAPHTDFDLLEVLDSPEDPLWGRICFVQPALFATTVSLAELWRSFGVEPGAAIGQSVGENAAACVIGALPLEQGARLATRWAHAQETIPGPGVIASVALAADELQRRLAGPSGDVEIVGVNGPTLCAVSGDTGAVEDLLAELAGEGVWGRKVEAGHCAAHSARVEEVRGSIERGLAWAEGHRASVPFYSSLTGDRHETTGLDAAYWTENIRRPVLFESAVRAAIRDGHRAFVEVSPHPVLAAAMREIGEQAGVAALGTMRRGQGGMPRMLEALAEAEEQGVAVEWGKHRDARPRSRGAVVRPDRELPTPRVRGRLAAMPEAERSRQLVELVREQVAVLLGIEAGMVEAGVAFATSASSLRRQRSCATASARRPKSSFRPPSPSTFPPS